jgi:hypothetical protein
VGAAATASEKEGTAGTAVLLRQKIAEATQARSEIGGTPPGPPTARARLGAFLIGRVRRALFWLLPQLDRFHAGVIDLAQQQAELSEDLAQDLAAAQRTQKELAEELAETQRSQRELAQEVVAAQRDTNGRLLALDQHLQRACAEPHQRLGEMERAWKEIRENLRETGDSVRELDYRMKSQEERLPLQIEQLRIQMAARSTSGAAGLPDGTCQSQHQLAGVPLENVAKILKNHAAGSAEMPVLDVGSGDGGWLESLAAAGFCAAGVEENRVLAAVGAGKGVRLVGADPFTYLASLPGCCMGAVTALGWIGGLTLRQLIALLDEAIRILKPGGVAVFIGPETDDASGSLWPAGILGQLAQLRGFDQAEVIRFESGREALIGRKLHCASENSGRP